MLLRRDQTLPPHPLRQTTFTDTSVERSRERGKKTANELTKAPLLEKAGRSLRKEDATQVRFDESARKDERGGRRRSGIIFLIRLCRWISIQRGKVSRDIVSPFTIRWHNNGRIKIRKRAHQSLIHQHELAHLVHGTRWRISRLLDKNNSDETITGIIPYSRDRWIRSVDAAEREQTWSRREFIVEIGTNEGSIRQEYR